MIGAAIGSTVAGLAGASAQKKAAQAANETERYIFDRSVELTQPALNVGNNALSALAYMGGVGAKPQAQNYQIEQIAGTTAPGVPQPAGGMRLERGGGNALAATAGRTTPGSFRVGDQTFATREEAQEWIDRQQGNFDFRGFEESPGYQFQLAEGQKAIERGASARGMRLSSGTLKDFGRFGQGLASQEYGNYWNRLAGLSGAGQTAVSQQIGAGQNYANAFGNNAMAAGQARASGYQAVGQGINSLASMWQPQQQYGGLAPTTSLRPQLRPF